MADSQVDSQQTPATEEQSSGLFSSSFSKIGNALPSFSVPWGAAKNDDQQQQQQLQDQQEQLADQQQANEADGDAEAAAAAEGGFLSKLTGGLPSVNIGLPSMPWSKKDGEAATEVQQDGESQSNGTGQSMLAGMSGGFSKLTGGLPSVNVPSFGLPSMPWSKKDGELATETETESATETSQDPDAKSDSLAGESLNAMKAGADKLSSAMTGIFGVFKSGDDSAPKAEEDAASK